MINGTYDVAIDTPKYHRRGVLSLASAGETIDAHLEINELDPLDFTGTCDGTDFTIEGEGELPSLGQVAYRANGNAWGNSLTIDCETDAGKVTIFGTRLSASTGGFKSSHEYMMKASTGEFDPEDNTMYSGLYADGG